ncbi:MULTISPECIES: hypothetical protein [Bacillus]|uniref:Uncharacterized protein n=1 Tax=Bacillus glycinifermentans TaxID=1664069 RepID=A0A0T6BI19_9BACI|nr:MULTISPECIES: hypothetical protein [Bacillus]KRT87098.1 hypothetical protein AB447_209020 [Bacillus glycinifermentans]MCF7618627.1 hypothetical protein [Bacillus sonorensis]MCY7858853.1 hypothetical protein [Bacillus sonorensis]MCY8034078.1 hypothetical protein [Bacillus sonorensis]MCY8565621.1 hypothetical protein [Bacillus sonorensis]
MSIKTLYGVVLKSNNGGEKMSSFLFKDSALNEAEKLVSLIKSSSKKGFKVYLSDLEYDEYKNVILSDSLIDSNSELIFEN